jgi:hypothetical protein
MSPDEHITPALSAAKQRRATLHEALVHLEIGASSPATGREAEWVTSVVKELVGVRDALEQHIFVTEKPDGLYDEITMLAPRLDGTIHRLRSEHPELTEQVTEMLARLETFELDPAIDADAAAVEQARGELLELLAAMMRHRQKGADLVWEAYNVDIGGPE